MDRNWDWDNDPSARSRSRTGSSGATRRQMRACDWPDAAFGPATSQIRRARHLFPPAETILAVPPDEYWTEIYSLVLVSVVPFPFRASHQPFVLCGSALDTATAAAVAIVPREHVARRPRSSPAAAAAPAAVQDVLVRSS